MKYIELLFGFCLFIVFYTYLGYGLLLYLCHVQPHRIAIGDARLRVGL